ncbi:MAG: phosphate ABC transporter substrate-binding protein [Bdellovibrionota bacterium]
MMHGLKVNFLPLLFGALLFSTASAAIAKPVVIVNLANQTQPDREQVKNIFLGKARVFAEGSPAKPVDLPEGSSLRRSFYSAMFGKTDMDMKLYWSTTIFTGAGTPPKTLESEKNVVEYVKENPNAIGYVESATAGDSVKVLFSVE